ncbi:MAG: vitamin B12-dependent ribonucleotide reductase [candidate division KSB1 bacterium]|nr:vitamin B12-dependent ribonucleotide reductase [candidate division KSB1 bacterium]MDZ7398600.1 vitamin B12-dependent ribonucleotide reductase [candidate division KSB1 bacterium]
MPLSEPTTTNSQHSDDSLLSSSRELHLTDSENNNGKRKGLSIVALFTPDGIHPFEKLKWVRRTASISNDKGATIFEQKDVEFPESWSQTAVNVVTSKYFHGKLGTPKRETSVKQLIDRVAKTIRNWGYADGYFASEADADNFYRELTYLLVNQMASFNSPVWFNCGIEPRPQVSACFINSVQDSMESILTLAKTEGMLFKWGSGTGTNFSTLRSSKEKLSTGGESSGPISFMKGFDSFAGAIKSGGKTRRAAKMVILNIDHPDIVEFINCKANEEKKAWALIDAGYDGSFNGEAYSSIFFQNANHSVRVTDDFMRAALENKPWQTRAITTGEIMDTYQAKDLLDQIAAAAHLCGDPGLQFDTTINDWHTCPNSARINASNPCSEYMFIDDTACNLASLNLMKFRNNDGRFNVDSFRHAVRIMIIAQDILVHNASYPTKAITKNSHLFRTLGLGYANLGALLMASGLPYDSEEGRAYAAVVTAIMTGQAYQTSAEIASKLGPFPQFQRNRKPMLHVIEKHLKHVDAIQPLGQAADLIPQAQHIWEEALRAGKAHGYRNAQVTVLAPTGTIGFMMDCDTTGIEPDIALLKYKNLVGGGVMKLVNTTIPAALKTLGYSDSQCREIIDYLNKNDTIEGAPHLAEHHLPVFDCAFKPAKGSRSIHYMGHIRMMAAVQPFISGAISKTVNMPNNSSIDDVREAYIQAWKLGLKAIAIYRDGAKRTQPLSTSKEGVSRDETVKSEPPKPYRRRLPDERPAITHKFSIAGHEGYITVGMYEDGSPGEIFIVMAKEGSIISGLMDAFATAISMTLQYGVPLKVLVDKFSHVRFEPSGFTGNPQIPIAKSVLDYIFRWLALKFLPEEERPKNSEVEHLDAPKQGGDAARESYEKHIFQTQSDAPPCFECGSIMVRNGACYKCLSCGSTSGCS